MRTGFIWVVVASFILGIFVAGDCVFAVDVKVDGARRYQTIEGFGTCLIAWSGRFRELYRTEEFQKIYVEGVGFNMLRVNMWGPTFEKPTEDFSQIRCDGFGDVQVSAFLHEGGGELAIIAINPTGQEQPLNLTFSNLKAPASLKAYRTSASENMQQAGKVTVNNNKAAFRMMSQSIVTLSGKIR